MRWEGIGADEMGGNWIGDTVEHDNGDVGFDDFGPLNEPDFNDAVGLLTNGQNEWISLKMYEPSGGGVGCGRTEAEWFGRNPQNPDLAGYDVTLIRLVIYSLSIQSEDMHALVEWEFWGTRAEYPPVPEFPLGSAMPAAIVPLLFFLWRKRKQKTQQ